MCIIRPIDDDDSRLWLERQKTSIASLIDVTSLAHSLMFTFPNNSHATAFHAGQWNSVNERQQVCAGGSSPVLTGGAVAYGRRADDDYARPVSARRRTTTTTGQSAPSRVVVAAARPPAAGGGFAGEDGNARGYARATLDTCCDGGPAPETTTTPSGPHSFSLRISVNLASGHGGNKMHKIVVYKRPQVNYATVVNQ